MLVKSVLESVAGVFPVVQSGILSFWIALFSFSIALSLYRIRAKVYPFAAIYFGASALAFSSPALAGALGLPALPVTLALVAASRFSLAIVTGKACDSLIHKAWLVGSLVASSAIVAAAIMAAVVGPSSYEAAEAGAMVVLALHAVAATPFFALAAGGAPAAPRLIGGSAPWGLVWASAAALSAARLLGFDAPDALDGYAAIAVVAADGVMGLAVLLGVMLELAKPAPEDTALDDYALKMDAYTAKVGASIKRFIPTEFLQHLEKADFFDLKLGDHVKKDMTIFFSDIRAFTEMSERLTTEESFSFINSYLARVVPVINDHGGFVDKYMGDGIMALFAEHGGADQAVESAVEMQKKMVEYNGHRAKVNYRPISMGIGIHTGQLMLGVVGVADRMEGTVISDAVNLSSRLQSIAKAFNIPLVISERTFMQLEDPGKYKYRFIGKVRVKGKDAPVSVFEIFDGLPEELFERKMKSNTFFEQGMLAYYQKDYSQGVFYFKRALENVPDDGASRFYLETCLRKAIAPKPAEK